MFVIICYCHLQVLAVNDLIALAWSWGVGSRRAVQDGELGEALPFPFLTPSGFWVSPWLLNLLLSHEGGKARGGAAQPILVSKGIHRVWVEKEKEKRTPFLGRTLGTSWLAICAYPSQRVTLAWESHEPGSPGRSKLTSVLPSLSQSPVPYESGLPRSSCET